MVTIPSLFSRLRPLALGLFLLPCLLRADTDTEAHVARAGRGMVATGHPLATQAAVDVLRDGGNAIDAAVAAGLMLGVVDGHNSGIGGGCFILIHLADGRIVAIDGREMAPAAAHSEMYLVDGVADTSLSQSGPLASGVPGALKAYSQAVEEFGNKPLAELLQTGARAAEEGFPISRALEGGIRSASSQLRRFEASRSLFFKDDGSQLRAGEILKLPDLAQTYRKIAEEGTDWFYKGEFARTVAAWMKENGGVMTEEDFASYHAPRREPIRTKYRGHEIIGFSPPSSGGVHVAQILNILGNFDLASLKEEPAERVHIMAEAMKLAFADRAHWLGDPDFVPVPRGLADADYAAKLASRIDPEKVIEVRKHSVPPDWEENIFSRHTTHFSTADAEGNWVAITATVNTAFGSKVVIPGTGVVMNNEMDDFSIHPGVPNAFGLIGSDANKVEPGKRPLSSMSPTLVLRDGKPILSVGAAGGPTIITQAVLAIVGLIDLGLTPGEALAQPRFHNQWFPDQLRVESQMPEEVVAELSRRGHKIQKVGRIGVSQAVVREGDQLIGVHDPRTEGMAAGW